MNAHYGVQSYINYDNLMKNYILVCGSNYLCENVSVARFSYPDLRKYQHVSLCPDCKCDVDCINRGDCCPDKYFGYPKLTCVNRTIIDAKLLDHERKKQYKRLMVTTCPGDSTEEVRKTCNNVQSDLKFRLLHQPVTDISSLVVFANRYCAECHNVTDYLEWNIDINCTLFADFNFLSTLDEIIRHAYESLCAIQSVDESLNKTSNPTICLEDNDQIRSCNTTGRWNRFDSDVKAACESEFTGQFRVFRNIFCFMCNPSKIQTRIETISSCNTSGIWEPYDAELEKACNDLPTSDYTKPFKNIFCFLCNRNNAENGTGHFAEVHGTISEDLVFEVGKLDVVLFRYQINVESFNTDYFRMRMFDDISDNPSLANDIKTKDAHSMMSEKRVGMNFTNIAFQYASTYGEMKLCPSRRDILPPSLTSNCTCDPVCLFLSEEEFKSEYGKFKDCCVDVMLDYPASCRREFDFSADNNASRGKSYLVTKGCFQARSKRIYYEGCVKSNANDIFEALPLTINATSSVMGGNVHITYDNLYCVLCNVHGHKYTESLNNIDISRADVDGNFFNDVAKLEEQEMDVWDLEIFCNSFLPYTHNIFISDIVQMATGNVCKVRYKTETSESSLCARRKKNVHDCSTINSWTFPDDDIKWACLNISSMNIHQNAQLDSPNPEIFDPNSYPHYRIKLSTFKNKFCGICYPEFPVNKTVIDTCNNWSFQTYTNTSHAEYFCSTLNQVYYFYPFKNVFCAKCNGMRLYANSPGKGSGMHHLYVRIPGVNWFPILRNMFSISEPTNAEDHSTEDMCGDDQILDPVKVIRI